VRRKLTSTDTSVSEQEVTKTQVTDKVSTGNVATAEIKGASEVHFNSTRLGNRGATVASAVKWQLEFHVGFVRSFISSLRYGSISGKEQTWGMLKELSVPVVVLVGDKDPIM
jgi:hypothetical protein